MLGKREMAAQMTNFEKVIVAIDRNPISAVYRAAIGFIFIPILSLLHVDTHSAKTLIISLLLVLFAYRLFLMVVRKLLKFSSEANAVWGERRELAKRFDCYQWQKLLFIGLGIGCYIAMTRDFVAARLLVSGLCIASGLGGLVLWISIASDVRNGLVNKSAL